MNTYLIKTVALSIGFFLFFCFLPTVTLYAQGSQMLSVTPPLFQLSASPGDLWQSSIKVVNGNKFPLTIYAEVVDFEAIGEAGQGTFIPIMDRETDASSLAYWIEISKSPHVIDPEQSTDIPFFVEIPKDASPGGHYAAVLITTKPSVEKNERVAVQTSQTVTSLFFVRIEGDVDENGTIREFSLIDSFLSRPEAEFSLRFENKGNVHLQPRGSIVITNMWGTERGVIPINYQTHFGNVLPKSIRDFKFTWKSDFSITDVGRYTAHVALAYGENGIKSVTDTVHFWVIPVKATLVTLLCIGLFISLIVWMIKMYVRRMLTLAGVSLTDVENERMETSQKAYTQKTKISYRKISAPLRDGVLDLRTRLNSTPSSQSRMSTVLVFIQAYKMFFISLVVIIVICLSIALYIGRATQDDQDYKVIIDEGDMETTLERSEIENQTKPK